MWKSLATSQYHARVCVCVCDISTSSDYKNIPSVPKEKKILQNHLKKWIN